MHTLLPHFDPFDPLLLFETCFIIWPLCTSALSVTELNVHALTFPVVSKHIYNKLVIKVCQAGS